MVTKRKLLSDELQPWHWFIPLFIIPFVFFFYMLSSNSLAITEQEYFNTISSAVDLLNEKENKSYIFDSENYIYTGVSNWGVSYDTFLDYLDDFEYISSYYTNYGSSSNPNYEILFPLFNYNSDFIDFGNSKYLNVDCYFFSYIVNSNSVSIWRAPSSGSIQIIDGNYTLVHNFGYKFNNVLYENNLSFAPANSITLISSSHRKFTFTDFNQCNVYITGDWDFYDDFTFMLQRYIDDEWEDFAGSLDYLKLLDYENPYYVHWVNMNYYPVGTYRYRALLNDSEDTYFYSEPFQITSSVIENDGTGTIDNGDIDISIDTGETVDNIKDFFGSPTDFNNANISQEDIESAFNITETSNPYDNFLLDFIDGLTTCLTDVPTDSWTFKVHSWGQTFSIDYEDFIPNYPTDMRNFLSLIWTVVGVIYIVKWVTKITEAINVGDISQSLELIEEKYSDLL